MRKQSRTSNIIKWYEYNMDEIKPDTPEENPDEVSEDVEESNEASDTGTTDVDQALIDDIMDRFRNAKQSTVDLLFAEDDADMAGDSSGAMDEDALIASICAPKQNNVDYFVQSASTND